MRVLVTWGAGFIGSHLVDGYAGAYHRRRIRLSDWHCA